MWFLLLGGCCESCQVSSDWLGNEYRGCFQVIGNLGNAGAACQCQEVLDAECDGGMGKVGPQTALGEGLSWIDLEYLCLGEWYHNCWSFGTDQVLSAVVTLPCSNCLVDKLDLSYQKHHAKEHAFP